MTQALPLIRKLSCNRKTPAGNAVSLLVTSNHELRTSLTVRNEDASLNLYVKAVNSADTAPTTTTVLDTPYILKPGESRTFDFGRALAVYGMASGGGAGTINVLVEENQGGQPGSEGGDSLTVSSTSLSSEKTDDAAFTPGTSKVMVVGAQADEASPDSVDEGDAGALRMTLDRHLRTIFPAGTPYFLVCDGTDELLVSSSARRLLYADIFHLNDAPCFAKLYDKATAPDENDTPVHAVCGPANATAALGGGSNKPLPPGGIGLSNGLGVRVVKGLANNSDTAVDASEVIVCLVYDTRAA